ncbi:squamous cell carcinoma antigen recognized by T-cells 3 [Orussus abietinus]|uniref:squamous cell carcinoma antigen recognized by T-cells 3 n=1 Tax=Orussus abietinus TaxID=222816 RepID=UPI000626E027|nr:squamous cell carcinoma antigen recognized by T-cells 3 [Orussus abietinus]XP_012282741.1 squamous cell carcinoma antigen recognized by T-cells 3 [Orussus abietinus]
MEVDSPAEDEIEKEEENGENEENGDSRDLEEQDEPMESEQNEEETSNKVESEPSDSDDDEDNADETEVALLETSLVEDPYNYASHVALIAKLQRMGELERLRAARENMSSKYPLSPDLWLSWLQDEIKLATTPEQKAAVVQLCERAVKDYLSIDIWLEYLQFSIGNMGSEKDAVKDVRQLFERALTSVGLHFTKGAIIWEAFREFETALLAMVDVSNKAERIEQLDRIGSLFRRQLACPLLDMEKAHEEYVAWRASEGAKSNIDDSTLNSGYTRAIAKCTVRLPFEEKLLSAQGEAELLDAFKGYLLHEKQNGDPGRITVLYERAVSEISLEASLWLDYINYLEDNIKMESVLLPVYERAVRNVPWCAKIWQKWIRSFERWKKPLSEVQSILENALAAGFPTAEEYRDVWLTYLEYLRRGINRDSEEEDKQLKIVSSTFNKACEHLANNFGLEGDPSCVILQYWARTEAIHADDIEKARKLWADILSQGHSSTAASWLEYIRLERSYGFTKHLRKLYQKALTSVKDWPESIATAWLNFERDEGTLEQMEFCEAKIKERMDKLAEERQKAQNASPKFETTCSGISNRKAKRKIEDGGRWKNLGGSPKKLFKEGANVKLKSQESVKRSEKKGAPQSIEEDAEEDDTKVEPPPGYKAPEREQTDEESTPDVDDKIAVFISNLDYSATEEDVKAALAPAGPITMFKMIRDYKGRSKGFCYVQLTSPEAVERALQLDRTNVNNRPMFVSRCDPNKSSRGSAFKYRSSLEKNKLFVKGLPVSTTKEDLEELFGSHGTLKDVRIVTYRNGHSKGLAYVEFQDEVDAKKALLATDGTKVKDKVISVAISHPPDRKKGLEETRIKSLGGSSVSRTVSGLPKTLLSLVPRSVKTVSANGNAGTSDSVVAKPALSNQDFRKMLLNKRQ